MTTERLGGAFLIQDLRPQRFIGSIRAGVSKTEPGYFFAEFHQEPDQFCLKNDGDRSRLVLSRTLAAHFIGMLVVQAHVISRLRGTAANGSPVSGTSTRVTSASANRETVILSWPSDTEGIVGLVQADGANLRVREDLILDLASTLADEIARLAALP